MRTALLADIHANREALDAVLDAVAGLRVDRVVVLGDIVGYGPDPDYAVEKVAELVSQGAFCVKGNHDEAVLSGPAGMNDIAREAVAWTRTRLSAHHMEFLGTMPLEWRDGDDLFVHASALSPERWHYVGDAAAAADCLEATDATNVFCGHTHLPAIHYALPGRAPQPFTPRDGVATPLSPFRRHVVVVGSVGQPRDRNPAACLGLVDQEARTMTMLRIPYDHETTARKIDAAGLSPWLGMRLRIGR